MNEDDLRKKIEEEFVVPIFTRGVESVHLSIDLCTEEFKQAMANQIIVLFKGVSNGSK